MAKAKETRIIIMSNDLMKLYDMQTEIKAANDQPLTFYDPQECLEMMIGMDEEELEDRHIESAEAKAERLAKQWGELELRLTFFPSKSKWQ
jgi:hypothetical protein